MTTHLESAESGQRSSRLNAWFLGLVLAGLLAACGGGGADGFVATGGVAQKGPLIKASTVTAQELDARLSPTGRQYSYQVTTDLGSFSPTSTFSSRYIGLVATGYYFDEVQNSVSTGPVTLSSYADLAADPVLNVNLLTTLAFQRIQRLVTEAGMTFASAKTQAEAEVLAALRVPPGRYGGFATLDLLGTRDEDRLLAAISSMFVQGRSAGALSALIANVQNDIGRNGAITEAASLAALNDSAKAVDAARVAANLTQAFSAAGVSYSAANISDWLDQDGDGVIGRFEFRVGDATPTTVFTLPAATVDRLAGTTVSASAGRLSVNGTAVSGPVPVRPGDVVTVAPAAGPFPGGTLDVYLSSGTARAARVSFARGLVSIALTPDPLNVPKGLDQPLAAIGNYSDGSQVDLSARVAWAAATPTIASVDSASGLAHANNIGATVVTATSGTVVGQTTLNVTAAQVRQITIRPAPAVTGIRVARPVSASGLFTDGSTADITSGAAWSSSPPGVATIGGGRATGLAPGTTTVSATFGAITATGPLSVIENAWAGTAPMSDGRTAHTATLLRSGKVLVAGGFGDSAELYDPVTETWSPAGSLTIARGRHTATLLRDGTVLVVGGLATNGDNAVCELYDPASNTWSRTGSTLVAHGGHSATLLADGRVLVAGGSYPSLAAEIYDPITRTWSATGTMADLHGNHVAALLRDGKVLVAGGESSPVPIGAEVFDPVTNTWSSAGVMSRVRVYATATLLASGKVLVVAGDSIGGQTNTAELYDPASNSWSAAGSPATERYAHSATLLPDGQLLVAGGWSLNGGTASAALYDAVADRWTEVGGLLSARWFHAAVLLPDGAVLVTGGDSPVYQFRHSSAELFLY